MINIDLLDRTKVKVVNEDAHANVGGMEHIAKRL